MDEHNGTKTVLYRTNAKSQDLVPAHFALIIIIIVVHVVKHIQKAGEPENYAGFLKHNSQLNCSYSYPSRHRLHVVVTKKFGCTSIVSLNATYIRPYSACELTRAQVMYYMPIYIVYYVLVGGVIGIRDPYICAVHGSVPFTSLCQQIARCLPQVRYLCSVNVAIGFKISIEVYFVEKKNSTRTLELLEDSKLRYNF